MLHLIKEIILFLLYVSKKIILSLYGVIFLIILSMIFFVDWFFPAILVTLGILLIIPVILLTFSALVVPVSTNLQRVGNLGALALMLSSSILYHLLKEHGFLYFWGN